MLLGFAKDIYVGQEYPLAVENIKEAIKKAKNMDFLEKT